MPKMLCECGTILRWSEIPNPIEWLLIKDTDYDQFPEMIDSEELYKATTSLLRCPSCDRLWVFWDGWKNDPTPYEPGSIK